MLSAHKNYLIPDNNYKLNTCSTEYHDCNENLRTWTIKPASNGDYNVISSNGQCLCIRGNDPALCNIGDQDATMKLISKGNNLVGFQGKNGKYLRAGLFGKLNTASKMDSWETWTLYSD